MLFICLKKRNRFHSAEQKQNTQQKEEENGKEKEIMQNIMVMNRRKILTHF